MVIILTNKRVRKKKTIFIMDEYKTIKRVISCIPFRGSKPYKTPCIISVIVPFIYVKIFFVDLNTALIKTKHLCCTLICNLHDSFIYFLEL